VLNPPKTFLLQEFTPTGGPRPTEGEGEEGPDGGDNGVTGGPDGGDNGVTEGPDGGDNNGGVTGDGGEWDLLSRVLLPSSWWRGVTLSKSEAAEMEWGWRVKQIKLGKETKKKKKMGDDWGRLQQVSMSKL